MSVMHPFWRSAVVVVSCLPMLAGCGGGSPADDGASAQADAEPGRAPLLPPVSIRAGRPAAATPAAPPSGSPEWLVASCRELRARPFPEEADVDELAAVRRNRNREIVRLATDAIARTHDAPEQEELFTDAVRQLMEARLQLAIQGGQEEIDALYEDAASLVARDSGSPAAAEAAFVRARFAHANALRFSPNEPRWLQEFARQARLFAADFPNEELRALPLLFAAGSSCDLHGLNEEASGCYALLQRLFPDAPQAAQAAAALRRLELPGQTLQFAGPTLDGGYVSIDDFRGRPVLIVFWAGDSPRCVEVLAHVSEAVRRHERHGLAVIGVCLADDEAALDHFLEQNPVSGPQIFHADPAQRRWNHPIVRHYGLREIPAVWLVDGEGVVIDTEADPAHLDEALGVLRPAR